MTQARRWVATAFGGPEVLEQIVVDLPEAKAGHVTVEIRAAGMNPADYKHFATGQDAKLPLTIGYEVAGVIAALGPNTEIAQAGARSETTLSCSASLTAIPRRFTRPPRTCSQSRRG